MCRINSNMLKVDLARSKNLPIKKTSHCPISKDNVMSFFAIEFLLADVIFVYFRVLDK